MNAAPATSGSLRMLLAALALAMLAACTTTFDARVQSFQAMPPTAGQTFYVVPKGTGPAGLEFQTYAGLVGDALVRQGMVKASSADEAAVLVRMEFGSGPPSDRIGTRPGMAMGGAWGWWGRPWGWGGWGWHPGYWGSFYDPFWGPGWQNELYSYTTYPVFLHVDMVRQADKAPLFEGRAESATRVNDLPRHMPKLVDALFTDFPGPPSRSTVVRVPT